MQQALKLKQEETFGNKAVSLIRKHIKRLAPSVSVKKGTGTASMWIEISGSADEFGNFTEQEQIALYELGLTTNPKYLSNFLCFDYEQRRHYLKVWGYY